MATSTTSFHMQVTDASHARRLQPPDDHMICLQLGVELGDARFLLYMQQETAHEIRAELSRCLDVAENQEEVEELYDYAALLARNDLAPEDVSTVGGRLTLTARGVRRVAARIQGDAARRQLQALAASLWPEEDDAS